MAGFLVLFMICVVAGEPTHAASLILAANDAPTIEEPEEPPAPGELGEKLDEVARKKMKQGTRSWQRALERLSAHGPSGWLLCVVAVILGFALLGFGDRMVEKAFIPVVSLVGIGAGGYLGLQLCILVLGYPSDTSQAVSILGGVVLGGLIYAVSAIKAPPVAWMLLVATPFLMLSAMLATTSPIVAAVSGSVGTVLAILACLRHHVLATISTSMLGAFALTFSWGLLMHLVPNRQYRAFFVRAIDHPYVLALVIVLLIGAGVDFQLLFSRERK